MTFRHRHPYPEDFFCKAANQADQDQAAAFGALSFGIQKDHEDHAD